MPGFQPSCAAHSMAIDTSDWVMLLIEGINILWCLLITLTALMVALKFKERRSSTRFY